jgi:hypothetical protein
MSHLPFCHQTLGNGHTLLKITFALPKLPLLMSPKSNVNVTIEGSCDIQRFLIFATHFANFYESMLQVSLSSTTLSVSLPLHNILEPTAGVTFFNNGFKSGPTELFPTIVLIIAG